MTLFPRFFLSFSIPGLRWSWTGRWEGGQRSKVKETRYGARARARAGLGWSGQRRSTQSCSYVVSLPCSGMVGWMDGWMVERAGKWFFARAIPRRPAFSWLRRRIIVRSTAGKKTAIQQFSDNLERLRLLHSVHFFMQMLPVFCFNETTERVSRDHCLLFTFKWPITMIALKTQGGLRMTWKVSWLLIGPKSFEWQRYPLFGFDAVKAEKGFFRPSKWKEWKDEAKGLLLVVLLHLGGVFGRCCTYLRT